MRHRSVPSPAADVNAAGQQVARWPASGGSVVRDSMAGARAGEVA